MTLFPISDIVPQLSYLFSISIGLGKGHKLQVLFVFVIIHKKRPIMLGSHAS